MLWLPTFPPILLVEKAKDELFSALVVAPCLNANHNRSSSAGWFRLEWVKGIWGSISNDGVGGSRDQGRNGRWLLQFLYFFFYLSSLLFFLSDIWWTLLKRDTLHLSENLRLSNSQFPRFHRRLPRLVNVLAESNLAAERATGQTKPLTFCRGF